MVNNGIRGTDLVKNQCGPQRVINTVNSEDGKSKIGRLWSVSSPLKQQRHKHLTQKQELGNKTREMNLYMLVKASSF